MNIKQAEALSGVSRQNIRFYEREELITPDRNPENDYREYNEQHIHLLKQIRAMRMLDMPLEQIKAVLTGKVRFGEAVQIQETLLRRQMEELSAAIRFCGELKSLNNVSEMNVDEILIRMESPENKKKLSWRWLEDYRKVALAEREKAFTFIPDSPVTNEREFSTALFSYANAQKLDLVITKESMYPEFTLNGTEYAAERYYTNVRGIPVATIRCTVKHPEDFEPDMPSGRKKLMKLLNLAGC